MWRMFDLGRKGVSLLACWLDARDLYCITSQTRSRPAISYDTVSGPPVAATLMTVGD